MIDLKDADNSILRVFFSFVTYRTVFQMHISTNGVGQGRYSKQSHVLQYT